MVTSVGGKCLDAAGQATANGTQILIWDCWGGANQKWSPPAVGATSSIPVSTGQCLDVSNDSTADGAKVQ